MCERIQIKLYLKRLILDKKKGAGGFPRAPNRNIRHVHPLLSDKTLSQFVVVAMHGSCLSDLFFLLSAPFHFNFLFFFWAVFHQLLSCSFSVFVGQRKKNKKNLHIEPKDKLNECVFC